MASLCISINGVTIVSVSNTGRTQHTSPTPEEHSEVLPVVGVAMGEVGEEGAWTIALLFTIAI